MPCELTGSKAFSAACSPVIRCVAYCTHRNSFSVLWWRLCCCCIPYWLALLQLCFYPCKPCEQEALACRAWFLTAVKHSAYKARPSSCVPAVSWCPKADS